MKNLNFASSSTNFSRVNCKLRRQFYTLWLLGFLALLAPFTSYAGINMNLHIYKYDDGFFAFPELRTNSVTTNPSGTAYFVWGPTSTATNGIHYELHPDNSTGGGSSVYSTWETFETAISGDWTLLVTNATSTNEYTFNVDTSGIGNDFFPEVVVTYPSNGASNVEKEPTFTWTGPVDWQGSLRVFVRDLNYDFYRSSDLNASEVSWPSPESLGGKRYWFRAAYSTNITSLLSISAPVNVSSNEFPGWVASAQSENFDENEFDVVSVSTGGGHTLKAHYTFDNDTIYAQDVSGQGNHIESSSSFGCGSLETTEASKVGPYAVNFFTDGGDCPVWLNPRTNLVSALSGSFTVSLWMKTSAVFGEDDDSIFSAAGLVSAIGGADFDRWVVPMAITGNKLAFYTGGSGGTEDTLYSQSSINTGDYVHLVVTRNQNTGEKKIYVDGVLDASATGSTTLLGGADGVDIGYNNGNGFDGDMDDIQVYTGMLSENEISFLFNNPGSSVPDVQAGGHRNLAHYAFDQSNLGRDSSSQESDINCGATWGLQEHELSANSISGTGAIQFFGVSALCINPDTQAYTNWSTALAGDFTFSVWVNTTNAKGSEFNNAFYGAGIFWAYNDEGTNYTIPISLTDGKVAFTTHADSSDTLHSLSRVNDGAYHHIAVTRNGLTGEKKIYVDGQLEVSEIGTTEPLNASDYYSIGGDGYWIDDSGTNFTSFIGLLDDAQIYSGALSPDQIAMLYNNPGTTIPDGVQTPLGDAVEAPQFPWVTGGDSLWFAQTQETYDGIDAAQAGVISDNQESWIQTVVMGPGTLSFQWKLTDDSCISQLSLTLDGQSEATTYCSSDWDSQSVVIPPGYHTLRWTYSRYFLQFAAGLNEEAGQIVPQGAWLDQVTFSDQVAPHITLEPVDRLVQAGSNLVLNVGLFGNPAPNLQWFKNNVLVPGATNSTLVITNAQPSDSGFYYVTASNYLGEATSSTAQARVYLPTDLRPLSITAPSSGRGRIIVSWTGTNTGPASVSNVLYRVALATNGTILSTLGTGTLGSAVIPPQGSYSRTNDYRIPALPSGNYELLVEVDYFDGIIETNENNNTLSVPFTLPDVDIQLGNLQAASVSLANQSIEITWNTTNNGPGLIYGGNRVWDVGFFLSTDAVWDPDDFEFDNWGSNPPNLAAGEHFSTTVNTFLPHIASGNYYLILYADFDYDLYDGIESAPGILFESNETNNQVAIPIQIINPDLTPVRLVAPSGASPRQPIQIEWSIQNVGDALAQTANPSTTVKWSDRLYLSTNGLIHPGAVQLGTFSGSFYSAQNYNWLTPLPVGETITNVQTIHIPNVAERDYFIVISNNYTSSIREFVRTNNTRAIPIRVGYPDLVVTNITAPASADSQAVIPVVWQVQNQGFGTAIPSWRDRVYLSTNNTYQTNDTFLGEVLQTQSLGSGSNYFATNFVTVPAVQPGNYFLIVRSDTGTNLLESITNNNILATPINIASPDFGVTQVNTLTNLASQQAINVTFVVTNIGGTTALPPWSDQLYLSTNATFDAGDTALVRVSNGSINFTINTPLPVSGSYTQEVDVRIPPVNAGNYFLLAIADGANSFGEINEGNNVHATAIRVENPDLKPTNFIAQTSVTITQLNQRIEVGWNILNQGTGAAHVNWSDYLYLSPTNVFDTNAVFIGSENPTLPLNPGQSYLAFNNPSLPNGIQGNYFLHLRADGPNQLFESIETNNPFVSPLQIIIPPLADLSVIEIGAQSEAWSGQEIEVTWILTNSGTATVTQPFRERLYLATSAEGAGLVNFGTFDFTGTLAPGEAVERKQRITLPISMSGLRWPVVTTDISNDIFEFNRENNNTLVATQSIDVKLSPFPNLIVTNILTPTNVFSSQQTVVRWAVTNQGTGPTSSPYWYDSVYLSSDAAVGNDTHLANVANVSYLNPGESYVSSATVTLPRGIQGTYYFIIRSDAGNYVFESIFENDNVSVSAPFFIDLTPPPDLRVETVIPPLNAFSGQSIFVTWAVTNHGQGQTLETSWQDRVYLSADTNFNGGDIPLRSVAHHGGLEPGQGYRVTNIFNLPVGVIGDWYVLVLTDSSGNVFEVPFENNNFLAASSITSIALTPPPDLETKIELSPTNATSSRIISVRYSVVNNGATTPPDGSWYDRLFISTNPIPSAAGALELRVQRHDNQNYYGLTNYFGAPYLSHMAPGASYTNTLSAILPNTLTGVYYVFVTADSNDTVFELDNTNNTAVASNPVAIVSQPADLAVRTLQAPSAAEAGSAMLVSWAVTNLGVGDSAVTRWYDRLILSADDFLGDGDDINLRDRIQQSLLGTANEYAVSNEVVTIPITVSPGEYRLFLVADRGGDVYESIETNNVFGPVTVVITRDTADLQITNMIVPTSGISGTSFTVQWNVQNFGTRSPNYGAWVDGVYLSTDAVLSPSDLLLGRRQNVSQLAPGLTYTNGLSATLPPNLQGNFYVIIVTDEHNRVVEAGLEGNNTLVSSSAIPIMLSPVPDLAVTVNAPDEAFSGQIFDMSWTVQNIGTAPANGSWYEAVYLSLDHFLDPYTDFYLGYRYYFQGAGTNVAPGESYVVSNSFEVPQGLAGPYYVFVSTDTSGHVFERDNKNNNIAFDPVAMLIQLTPPVDLVAGPITIPANAVPGVNATITYIVSNFGSNTARGSWEDAIYISSDTNFDAGDSLLGRVRHRGDVLPNASYTNSITAPLPGVLPGDYHVIVRSDILNHMSESNETNNLGASLNSVSIDAELLVLGTPDTGEIDQGQSVFYKFHAEAGTTVRIRFNTGVALAGNEVFVRYNQMPTRGQFDFAINEPFLSDPDLFIPIEHTGTHYLLVYSSAMPSAFPAPYTILAEVLPFSVLTTFPNIAGDRGETTFKIKGALFDGDTVFQLVQDTNTIPAARFMLEDSSTAYVTFNLVAAPNGPWNLRAFMNSTSIVSSTLSNAVTVTSGGGGVVSFAINGPLSVWAVFTQRILAFYGNEGDSDVTAPLILLSGRDGTRVGTQIDSLRTNVLQLLGRSLDGPAQTLRPQSSHSHVAYYRGGGLHVQGRTVSSSDLHPITDEEWLEIESSVRPTGIEDADWFGFWSNIRPRVGSTWGDYVKFLNKFADPFPAEQRDVRAMFAFVVTNQPNFRASSAFSGVLLNSTNNAPLPNLEIAFFSINTNGAISLGGSATSDNNGQFSVPYMPAGKFVASIVTDSELEFDMDQDGKEDHKAPTFVVLNESDLLNQTIYLTEPAPRIVVTNDADATLVLDSQNVLHSFWFRNDLLWHSRNDNGNWVDAAPITTNRVDAFSVSKSAKLIDGLSPGLIVVWTQKETNRVDLHYSVGQSEGGSYAWSQPIQLTDDLVQNASPSVVVRESGLALVTYLKRGVGFRDDTDVYFSVIDVASGDLLRNEPAPASFSRAVDLGTKQSFGWTKEFEMKPFGLELGAAIEASGELTTQGCDAGASFKIEGSATVERGDYSFNLKGTGEGSFGFNVDPDQCEWIYKEDSASANVGLTATFGAKNIVFKVLRTYPPTTAFSGALEEFITGFGEYLGFEFENTLELKISGGLQGLHWDSPPASSFGIPKASKAELSIGGALKFGASYDNEIMVVDGTPLEDGLNFGGETSVELALKAQIYPKWDFLGGTLTPAFSVQVGSYKWAVPFPELVLTDEDAPVAARSRRDAPTFTLDGVLTWDPASVFGTANVYGTNSVVGNVNADLLNDGSPALAIDAEGNPYQIWYHDIDPFDARFGSELLMATFNGVNWTVPSAIPNTDGFNSQVSAATDSNGNRMAIWVHGDGSNISTNMTFQEFFSERRAVDVHYAIFNGSTWSAPQPITLTDGADSDLQLSYLANGDVLAVWTYSETNSFKHLVSSRWNGTTWSAIEQIASGNIRTPNAQQSGDGIYLLWTAVDRETPDSPSVSLYQSINTGGTWGTPTLFAPEPGTSSPLVQPSKFKFAQSRSLGGFVFGEIPDQCCKCKGKQITSATNEPPTDCGVSFVKYDYENCKKIYEYKACPLVSFDPNDIVGPVGFGPERWVGVNPLHYVIRFENDALLASAPAKEVIITLPMDEDFDARTFRLGNFAFGDISVEVPANQAFYSTRLDFTATKGFYVDFFAGVDVAKREAFWRLKTIDPASGALPINPLLGFLPPNTTSPEGEGFVSFSLRPNANTPNGARVDAKATIIFDTQPPIDTPPIFNSIETGIPVSSVSPLPAISHAQEFNVSWTGNDGVNGSGIAFYDIYASEDGGSFYLLSEATTLSSIPFVGQFGSIYAFYSIAHDNAGNVELAPLVADAQILVAASNTPPVLLSFTNAQVVEMTLFTRLIEATDADLPVNILNFELLDAPTGMTINATNGFLSWTSTEAQGPGTNVVVVKVSDDGTPALSATNNFTIVVLETNSPPAFVSAAEYTVTEQATLTFTNVVVDPDIPTNAVTLQLVSAPEGATFDAATGVASWTPDEDKGETTNRIIVRATDNGMPSASALHTNTIVVTETNSAPLFDTITNQVSLPLSQVKIEFSATDSDVPTNSLTFSLGEGSPGMVDPETGVFQWKPTLEFAGTSNVITAIVTDNGTPSLSTTQQFAIVVEDFAQIQVGDTAVFIDQTGTVPITAISSAPWRTMNFTLQLPTNILGEVALNNIGPSASATLIQLDGIHAQITFSNAANQTLEGIQQVAQLSFKAIATNSVVLHLIPAGPETIGTNGQSIMHLLDGSGRVTIVGERPVLDAFLNSENQHLLMLFGNPGQTYQLETTVNLAEPILWDFFTNVTMTNLVQPVGGRTNAPGLLFYRARQD